MPSTGEICLAPGESVAVGVAEGVRVVDAVMFGRLVGVWVGKMVSLGSKARTGVTVMGAVGSMFTVILVGAVWQPTRNNKVPTHINFHRTKITFFDITITSATTAPR